MAEISAQKVKELREKSGAGMMDCKKALAESDGDMDKAMTLLRERGAAIANKRAARAAKEGLVASYITPDHKKGTLVELNCESDFVARNDDFKDLAQTIAAHTAQVASLDQLLESKLAGRETVSQEIQNTIGKIGENIVLSRWTRLSPDEDGSGPGVVFSYIHPPGRIGVLVEIGTDRGDLAGDAGFREIARDVAMQVAATSPVCVRREELSPDLLEKEKQIYRNQALNEGKPEKIADKIVEGRVQKFYAEACLLEQPFAKDPDRTVAEYMKQNGSKYGELTVNRFVRYRVGESGADEQTAE